MDGAARKRWRLLNTAGPGNAKPASDLAVRDVLSSESKYDRTQMSRPCGPVSPNVTGFWVISVVSGKSDIRAGAGCIMELDE
jgi:hypothetical protein